MEVEISALHTMYVAGTLLIPPGIDLFLTFPFQNVRLKVVPQAGSGGRGGGGGL